MSIKHPIRERILEKLSSELSKIVISLEEDHKSLEVAKSEVDQEVDSVKKYVGQSLVDFKRPVGSENSELHDRSVKKFLSRLESMREQAYEQIKKYN